MHVRHTTTIAAYLVLAIAGTVQFLLPESLPVAEDCPPATQSPGRETIVLKWSALQGSECAGGVVGSGARPLTDFGIGQYLVVSEHLVVRARAEVDNERNYGSFQGNIADLCLDKSNHGLGVGSFAQVGRPGSASLSGGGDSGSELVSFICSGDLELEAPRVVPARSVQVQVADFDPAESDVSLVLHALDGQRYVFPPDVVEQHLTHVAPRTYDIRFKDLPGIAEVPALKQFDVRSGWFDADRQRLTGGQFWLTAVSFDPETVSPTHVVYSIYD
jgi:hypothetical protein